MHSYNCMSNVDMYVTIILFGSAHCDLSEIKDSFAALVNHVHNSVYLYTLFSPNRALTVNVFITEVIMVRDIITIIYTLSGKLRSA